MELYASAFDLVMVCLGHVVVWTKYMSIYGAYKRMKANTHCCPTVRIEDVKVIYREAAQAVTHHLSNFSSHFWDT